MSEEPSKSWIRGPVVSLIIVLIALYIRRPDFRNFVDAKFALVKEVVGRYVPNSERKADETPDGGPGADAGSTQPPRSSVTDSAPPDASLPPSQARAKSGAVSESGKREFDLQRVCADPSLWPKTVVLKRNVYFPAVLDGKSVGILRAPIGSEVRLVTIRSGKLGLEYRGGGAWLDPEGTDFEDRVRLAFH